MRADLSGNTLLTARDVGTAFLQAPQGFYDSTSLQDRTDLYRVTLSRSGQLSLQLGQLTGDADLEILDADGQNLHGSYQSGQSKESLTVDLAAGSYYVHVTHFYGEVDYYLQIANSLQPAIETTLTDAATTSELPAPPVVSPANPPTVETPLAPVVIPNAAPVLGSMVKSGQQNIDALINPYGNYWDTRNTGGVITYSFYGANSGPYYGSETPTELNESIKASVREILSNIESYINVRFAEVEDTANNYGVIRYMFSDGGGNSDFYAYSYYPWFSDIGSDVHLNATWDQQSHATFSNGSGTNGYTTLIHETLHALGLKHPGNYDSLSDSNEGPFLDPNLDNKSNTVLSYNYSGAASITPLNYDIRALQYLYGARSNAAQNSVYQFTAPMHYELNGERFGKTSRAVNQAIWDSGGIDTIDLSGVDRYDYHVDLRDGGLLTTQTALLSGNYTDRVTNQSFITHSYSTGFAFGMVLENVISSGGNDRIIANDASNIFAGYGASSFGNDVLENTNGADILDLSGNARSQLSLTNNAGDLVVDWGTNNSIKVSGYFTGNTSLRIFIEGQYYTVTATGGWTVAAAPATSDQTVTTAPAESTTSASDFFVVPETNATGANATGANELAVGQADWQVATFDREALPETPPRCHCVLCRPIPTKDDQAPAGLNLVGQSHLADLLVS
ncbi:M10 family metallopeptidase C-terminal domain-containing protein [filamentous cyanobacterium LEGE 11480]|uniref:M10 family metallopeptidase C-terminal domain-containing protein n=1 Tax=Romeriopsis navalis LEGE 11480 TaxID=2777977 RepID=A0A928Z414_9CYAN|nr:pre-peptidase C-terminal domain-containing protein [Romeriopsis navalis]MBE9031264.1 M10 family metallopeptidase C-terminal domain-containing protein [Romeriopsis navalis LEGE 11480]